MSSYTFDFDISKTVDDLHEALMPFVNDLVLLGKHIRIDSDHYMEANKSNRQVELLRQRSMLEEPCSLSKLVDIKAVFDIVDGRSGLKGMREATFLEVVAPVLCPTYPNRVREWFCTVDTTETGFVDWKSLSQHLANRGLHLGESLSSQFKQLELATASSSLDTDADSAKPPLCFDEKPEGHLAAPTGFHVLKPYCLHAGRRKGFVGLCDDGCVRYFDSTLNHESEVLHFADNSSQFRLADVKISKERPHAYVADTAGVVLVYDTDQTCCRTGTIFKGYRLQSSNSVKPLSIAKTVKFDPLKMERPGMHMSNNRNPQHVKVDVDLLGLQSPVDVTRAMVTAIEPRLGGRDINFFVGWSEGTIASFSPELISPSTIGPTQVISGIHTEAVTCLHHHTANVELRGLISSSLDGSLVVTDLEKGVVKMRFSNVSAGSNPVSTNNWVSTVGTGADSAAASDARSLTQFDVSVNLPIIAAAGTQRYVALWSGQSRRHLATFADHRDDVVSLRFNKIYELVTMGSDRTIRVYDIRTYRPVQVIRDKERKYTGDPLTGMCVDNEDQSIVSWSGTPFTHRPIQGAVVLLAHGHPVTFADIVDDEHGTSIAITSNDTFELHAADTGDTVFKYVCARGSIKALAHDDSWKRIFILTETALEVVIVGERKPSRVFETGGYHLQALGFLQSREATPSYIVGGNSIALLFLCEKNGSGVLQQEHSVPLSSLTKHRGSSKIEVVTSIACLSDIGRVVIGTASGEVAVLSATRLKVNILFVFGADVVVLSKTVALMRRTKNYTAPGKRLWEKVVAVAAKKDEELGGKSFTEFRHTRQGKLGTQCDSITLIGTTHCIVGFGSGEAAIAELNGGDSRFIARFPAAFSTGIGCCFAHFDETLLCGDDEGYLARFDCRLHSKPTMVLDGHSDLERTTTMVTTLDGSADPFAAGGAFATTSNGDFTATATSIRTEKFFLDCHVAMTHIMHMPFAVTAMTMRAKIAVIGLECGKCVALNPADMSFLWKGDILIAPTVVAKTHQFLQYFGGSPVGMQERSTDDATEKALNATLKTTRSRSSGSMSQGAGGMPRTQTIVTGEGTAIAALASHPSISIRKQNVGNGMTAFSSLRVTHKVATSGEAADPLRASSPSTSADASLPGAGIDTALAPLSASIIIKGTGHHSPILEASLKQSNRSSSPSAVAFSIGHTIAPALPEMGTVVDEFDVEDGPPIVDASLRQPKGRKLVRSRPSTGTSFAVVHRRLQERGKSPPASLEHQLSGVAASAVTDDNEGAHHEVPSPLEPLFEPLPSVPVTVTSVVCEWGFQDLAIPNMPSQTAVVEPVTKHRAMTPPRPATSAAHGLPRTHQLPPMAGGARHPLPKLEAPGPSSPLPPFVTPFDSRGRVSSGQGSTTGALRPATVGSIGGWHSVDSYGNKQLQHQRSSTSLSASITNALDGDSGWRGELDQRPRVMQPREAMGVLLSRHTYLTELAPAGNNHSNKDDDSDGPTSTYHRRRRSSSVINSAQNDKLLQERRKVLPVSAKRQAKGPTQCYHRLALDRVEDPQAPPYKSGKRGQF